MTLPAHIGVEHLELTNGASSEGFVVSYIPVALDIPLQTLFPSDKNEYYIRAGSNFLPTPRAVLAGMFGRAPQPDLRISARLQKFERIYPKHIAKIQFDVHVSNIGRALSRDIFCNVRCNISRDLDIEVNSYLHDCWKNEGLPQESNWTLFGDYKLPPGSKRTVFVFSILISGNPLSDLEIALSCGSSNSSGRAMNILIPQDTLNEVYEHCRFEFPDEITRANDYRSCENLLGKCITVS